MRTPTVLCLLLSLTVGSSSAQVPVSADIWRIDSGTQREPDTTRKSILEGELASEAKLFADAHAELREALALRVPLGQVQDIAERPGRHRSEERRGGEAMEIEEATWRATKET